VKEGSRLKSGFWKWLNGQKPQWRNRRKPVSEEQGYVLDGKFVPADEANELAKSNPELIEKFRPATKRNGKVVTNAAHGGW
jgi:hypothetical protein